MSRDLYVHIKTSEDLEMLKRSIATALEVEITLLSPTGTAHLA
jgi:hypothetical protein